ncbi:MAG: DUF1127 domain-containing protein [Paracoccus sp. (in: a-proteobacteria)]
MTTMTMTQVHPVARMIDSLNAWLHHRGTRAQLERLSERELTDIGLCRADIEDVVKNTDIDQIAKAAA